MNKTAYSLGLYEKATPPSLSWVERLLAAQKHGFDFLEISIDESEARLERLTNHALQREIIQAVRHSGLPIRTVCLSGHRKFPLGSSDAAIRARSLEIMERALDLALLLGVRIIQIAGYDVYYEESTEQTRAFFGENIARCAAMAARAGVVLGFETMETPFMDTAAKAMRHVREIQSPYLQVYPDLGNQSNAALCYGHEVVADIASAQGHMVAAHLKETLPGHYREIPFGRGHVDFAAGIAAYLDRGVRIFVGEFWYNGAADWEKELHEAAQFLRNHLLSQVRTAEKTARLTQVGQGEQEHVQN
jgi:predicted hexulose-6-phosphate isomerase